MTDYDAYARRIRAYGLLTDPWLYGAPRFRQEPVVLEEREARAMARASEAIAEVYNEVCLLVMDRPALLDDFFGLSSFQKAMWLASAPLWHGVARADVFKVDGGFQIAELNSDTPTGEAEALTLGVLGREDHPGLVDPSEGLGEKIVDAALAMAGEMLGGAPAARCAAVIYPTELPEDLGLVRLYQRVFEARGWDVVLGSPYNVTYDDARGVSVFGKPTSLVLRHYKTDWWGERESAWLDEELEDPAPLEEPLHAVLSGLLEGRVAVVNPFGSVVSQNKRAMAFMWERIHELSQRAQATVRELVPPTKRLESMHKEQLAADKDGWVLKSDYGAEGDEVVIGKLVTQEEWGRSLALARPGRWIVQRYFEAETNAAGEVVNHGVYVVAGEAAGFYARVQRGATDETALSAPLLVRG